MYARRDVAALTLDMLVQQQYSHPQHRLLSLQWSHLLDLHQAHPKPHLTLPVWLHQQHHRKHLLLHHQVFRQQPLLMLHLKCPLKHHQQHHRPPLPTINVTTAAMHVTPVLVASATSQDSMEMTTGHAVA